MNKNDLQNQIVRRTNLNRKQVSTVVSEFLNLIKHFVISREKVALQGFGTFTTKHHSARKGRSFIGELITVSAYEAPAFRFSNTFKTALKEKNYSTDTLKRLDKFIKIQNRLNVIYKKKGIVGEYEFSEQEYSLMVDFLRYSLEEGKINCFGDKFTFSSLIEICKKWKFDENTKDGNSGFWSHIARVLTDNDNYQRIYPTITRFVDRMMLNLEIAPALSGKKYYATLLMHSLTPKSSAFAFFDLCFKVFKENLGFQYSQAESEWIVEKVILELRKTFKNNDINEARGVQVGSSRYFIQVGLRSFFLQKGLQKELKKFINSTLLTINQLYYNEPYKLNKRSRREVLLYEWWQDIGKHDRLNTQKSIRNVVVPQTKVTAKYIFNAKKRTVQLFIPPIMLESIRDSITVSVFVNDYKCMFEEIYTRKTDLIVESSPKIYDLDKLLDNDRETLINIRVEISVNGKLIYDSSKKLQREYILFDDETENKAAVNPSSNYILYTRNIDSLGEIANTAHSVGRFLYNIYPNVGDSLVAKAQKTFFIDRSDLSISKTSDIFLVGQSHGVLWHSLKNDVSKVFVSKVQLLVPDTVNIKSLEIRLGEEKHNLSRLEYQNLDDHIKIFNLSDLGIIPEGTPTIIEIFSYKKEKPLLYESIILLKQLAIKFNKVCYFDNMPIKLTITGSNQSKVFRWKQISTEVVVPYNDGQLSISVPCLQWRINNGECRHDTLHGIHWYKNFLRDGDFLEIEAPIKDREVFLKKQDGKRILVEQDHNNRYSIGRAIYALEQESEIEVGVCLSKDGGKKDYSLFYVSTKEYFIDHPIGQEKDSFFWQIDGDFVGPVNNVFKLTVDKDDNRLVEIPLPNKNCELEAIKSHMGNPGDYKVTVWEKDTKNVFGKFKEFWSKMFTVDHPYTIRYKNKKLFLTDAVLLGCADPVQFKFKYEIRNLKFLESMSDKTTLIFTGILYKDGEEIDYMFDEDGYKEEINPVYIIFRDNFSVDVNPSSMEAFYYDKWESEISNKTDNKKMKYDSLLKKPVYFEDDSHYHPIDYFKFVEEYV